MFECLCAKWECLGQSENVIFEGGEISNGREESNIEHNYAKSRYHKFSDFLIAKQCI